MSGAIITDTAKLEVEQLLRLSDEDRRSVIRLLASLNAIRGIGASELKMLGAVRVSGEAPLYLVPAGNVRVLVLMSPERTVVLNAFRAGEDQGARLSEAISRLKETLH